MKKQKIGESEMVASRLSYGCWRIAGQNDAKSALLGKQAVIKAYEAGYTLFDLADIYGGGRCEELFGEVLKDVNGMRTEILVATKCGIRMAGTPFKTAPFRYDFSEEHITASCDQSLKRMGIDEIDLYQLHRPDFLMDPEEVATAFSRLRQAGKVKEFGVSNFNPSQFGALQKACPMKLLVNQVEISLANYKFFEDGNLDYCLTNRITPMAWSPLAGGKLGDGGKDLLPWQERYVTDSYLAVLDGVAGEHQTTREVIALAWLLKHPVGIIPIVGSTHQDRIVQAVKAVDLDLSREEWYKLFQAARGEQLP